MARCLITGITGQDGWYLSGLLLSAGHTVHGTTNGDDAGAVQDGVHVHRADLRDFDSLAAAVAASEPEQVYNLAAMSSVAESWSAPDAVADVNGTGVVRLLRAVTEWSARRGTDPSFVQASSSEIFGTAPAPQSESTPLNPDNPYGAAKALAHQSVLIVRAHGLRASNVVLYNHESPRRPPHFVTRRITQGVAQIAAGTAEVLQLGDLEAVRDWGHAEDYMRAMVLAAHRDRPSDYVVASGRGHSVRDFVAAAFEYAGITNWADRVQVDSSLVRPREQNPKIGDPSRAASELGWTAQIGFLGLVALMMDSDLRHVEQSSS